jgi:UDP-GlcNAc3NAcA epimerase
MKIATIVGARPQFIKAATISRIIVEKDGLEEVMLHTGQHFDLNMSDIFFTELDIPTPDYNLGIGGGTHGENTGRMIEAIEKVLIIEKPNWVLVYGDTDSTLAGALVAAKLHIPLAHVEAGLRSFNRRMPEEINRLLTDHASDILFAPTTTAIKNLKREGISGNKVRLSGDVMYDATIYYKNRARRPKNLQKKIKNPFTLCTIHRAENTDDNTRLTAIVQQINQLARHTTIILPLHPRTLAALKLIPGAKLDNSVQIMGPVGFLEMTWLLSECNLVITDSGGLQKEAYFHKKPCITIREETEWVELVDAGFNKLVSPFESNFLKIVDEMLKNFIPESSSLFGDGRAADKIVSFLCNYNR